MFSRFDHNDFVMCFFSCRCSYHIFVGVLRFISLLLLLLLLLLVVLSLLLFFIVCVLLLISLVFYLRFLHIFSRLLMFLSIRAKPIE